MTNKKRIIILSSVTLSVAALAIGFMPKVGLLARVTADPGYTCPLPGSFVEIDSVITTAYNAGSTSTANTYKFRGTVTRRVGDIAYVQRVNQSDKYLYGLRITGVNTYANSLAVGNVVNFSGGEVSLFQGVPTFKLTASTNAQVAYATNPTGYEPVVYDDVPSLLANCQQSSYYNSGNVIRSNAYASNRLLQIRDLHKYGTATLPNDEEGKMIYACKDIDDNVLYVTAPSSLGFGDKFTQANGTDYTLTITGIFKLHTDSSSYLQTLDLIDLNDAALVDAADDNVVASSRTAKFVYPTTSGTGYTQFTIYNLVGHNDVPYVEVANFYNYAVFVKLLRGGNYAVTRQSTSTTHEYKYHNSYFDFTVNSDTDTIAVANDPNHLAFEEQGMTNGLEIIADGSETQYVTIDTASSHVYGTAVNYSFNLAKYNLDIIEDKSHNQYVPLQAMSLIFNDSVGYANRYNGKDLYSMYAIADDTYWNESTFGSTVSSEYAQYNYSCLCLAFEDIYGLCEVRGVQNETADAMLNRLGYESNLLSTNLNTYESAFIELIGEWFYEGHSGAMLTSGSVDADYLCPANRNSSTNWHNLYLTGLYNNDRFNQSYSSTATTIKNNHKAEGVTYSDNTAFITFDEFVKADGIDGAEYVDTFFDDPDYTAADFAGFDSPLMFAKAFKEIGEHGGIQNVVIDLTNNGGGRNDALIFLEAYMTSDPVHTSRNRLTGMTYDVHYDIDINYDGTYNANDTYEGTYNFYLMTSRLSFSCGNYLPTTAYDKGYAKIIGEQSGGGTCCVGYLSTAYGDLLRSSSNHFLGYWNNGQFHNNENGIPVDYEINYQYFHNDAYIANYINNL